MITESMTSPEIKELFIALAKAQGEMQAAEKNAKNTYQGNTYANIQSVFETLRKPLFANGLCVTQILQEINEKLCLVTILAHTSGQWIKSIFPLEPKDRLPQSIGAAITYARRYTILSLTGCVVGEIDDDGVEAGISGKDAPHVPVNKETGELPPKKKAGNVKYITEKQIGLFFAKTNDCPEYRENVIREHGAIDLIPMDKFNDILAHIDQYKKVPPSKVNVSPKDKGPQVEPFDEECPF